MAGLTRSSCRLMLQFSLRKYLQMSSPLNFAVIIELS